MNQIPEPISETILSYLTVILSWPPIFLTVSLFFIFKFQDSIKFFLKQIASLKIGPFEATKHQQNPPDSKEVREKQIVETLDEQGVTFNTEELAQIVATVDTLKKENHSTKSKIEEQEKALYYFIAQSEFYEFEYLSQILVPNTQSALLWFYNNPSTRENFLAHYPLPPVILNPIMEKESIFNVLVVNELLENYGVVFKASQKGQRFLKHLKLLTDIS